MNPTRTFSCSLMLIGLTWSVALCQTGNSSAAPASMRGDIEYNMSTGDRKLSTIEAGATHSLVLNALNRLCYSYAITIKTTRSEFDVKAADRLLGTAQVPVTKPDVQSVLSPVQDTVSMLALDDTSRVVVDVIKRAQTILLWAERELIEIASRMMKLKPAALCENPEIGLALRDYWTRSSQALSSRLSTVKDSLEDTRASITVGQSMQPKASLLSQLDGLGQRTDSLYSVHADLDLSLSGIEAQLKSDLWTAPMIQQFVTTHEDERVDITITRTNRSTKEREEIVFAVPTERRFRVRFSTGVVGTGVDSWHYDRVKQDIALSDTDIGDEPGDSTYSTWARVSGGDLDLVSPAFLVSVSLLRTPIDFNVSAGTTLRAVNGGTASLEPLFGVAVGVLDRLFLHAGYHLGREEVLLISRQGEAPNDVRLRPVPASLTRGDAVGVRWNTKPFVGFSLRLN